MNSYNETDEAILWGGGGGGNELFLIPKIQRAIILYP